MGNNVKQKGMHLALETDEQVQRARYLARKNARKFEFSTTFSSGEVARVPQLYFWSPSLFHSGVEADAIQVWIETGEGPEPS